MTTDIEEDKTWAWTMQFVPIALALKVFWDNFKGLRAVMLWCWKKATFYYKAREEGKRWEGRKFLNQMNFSLNYVSDEGDGVRLRFRTVLEKQLQEVFYQNAR